MLIANILNQVCWHAIKEYLLHCLLDIVLSCHIIFVKQIPDHLLFEILLLLYQIVNQVFGSIRRSSLFVFFLIFLVFLLLFWFMFIFGNQLSEVVFVVLPDLVVHFIVLTLDLLHEVEILGAIPYKHIEIV